MTATVSGRPRLSMRERDALERSAVQSLTKALDALVNPPLDGVGVAIALLHTGTALLRIAQLDVDETAKAQVLLALDSLGERQPKAKP